ncbi:flagellar export protein FliJ [Mesobacillus sp. AQ2]|jgi:flagellar protein FliJ|uniref:flagellar export protein FliJ n=1 Tax=unclassified Mesobacillus TaxID=2675270 RepID=UPI00203F8A8B|nr:MULTISPECIES: flagellar export protein FliJ [unclassified Mesobacillus]MCM3123311.1 flagellar biosynthesis chaperone FliJ [Mesobacillus sp. MER 33]MCM3233206.1 flagellar biosynthesis chaperone FliJ [Mesobacillus sp. MER 48]WHX42271.1 flagellar export protein FliJ [Mesobacillus sp. AQ2]
MRYQYKFDKILSLKSREMDEAQVVYQDSVKKFEDAAERLYELLKKKEDLESFQSDRLLGGLPVQEIRHHQQFIGNLEKSIAHYQKVVMNARNIMNFQQMQLMEKNKEVKKYEKIKEKDHLQFLANEKYVESRMMDEVSIQQYMNREIR